MMNPNSNKNFFSINQESNNYGNLKLNQEIGLNKMNISKTHNSFLNAYKHKKNLQNNGDNTNINNTGKNSHKKKKYFKYLLKNGVVIKHNNQIRIIQQKLKNLWI